MNEASFTSELTNMFRRFWLWPKKDPDLFVCHKCGARKFPVGGTPDMTFRDVPVMVEVKMFTPPAGDTWEKSSLPFDDVTPEQRAWLDMWTLDAGNFGYLALGMRHGRAGGPWGSGRFAWLVPWDMWKAIELMLAPHRKSLPLSWFKGQKPKVVQLDDLNANHLLPQWMLGYRRGGWYMDSKVYPVLTSKWKLHSRIERNLKAQREMWTLKKEEYERQAAG